MGGRGYFLVPGSRLPRAQVWIGFESCKADPLSSPLRVTFYRGGRALGDNENCCIEYLGGGEWECRVRSMTEREAGTWAVVAENKLGSSCRDWRVTVEREEEETSGGEMDSEDEEEDTEDEVLEEDLSVISADLYLARPVVINSGEESWDRHADEEEEDLGKAVVHLGPQVRQD